MSRRDRCLRTKSRGSRPIVDLRVLLLLSGLLLLVWITPTLKAQAKGRRGERKVRQKLTLEGATALHDVLFSRGKGGRLIQIDHLVLTAQGIVILETKDWGGTLTHTTDTSWVQKMGYRHPRTYSRHSPVEQNRRHYEALSRIVPSRRLADLVVMAGNCRFEEGFPERVVPLNRLIPELRKLGLDKGRIPPEILDDWARLKAARREGAKSRRQQMRQVTRSRWRFYREYYSRPILVAGLGLMLLAIGA